MPTTEYGVDQFFSNAGTSPKQVWDVNGVLGWSPHNMGLQSQDFTMAGWIKETTTQTPAATTAPDGTLTGTKLTANTVAAGNYDILYNHGSIGTVVGVTYTWSIYAKAAELSWIGIAAQNLNLNTEKSFFDLATGALGTRSSLHTNHAIQSVGNGWYRCSVTFVAASATQHGKFFMQSADNQSLGLPGTIGNGVYLWGAQLNRGATPLVYFPTTTAARFGLALDYDPVTHAARGLLCEPAATNLVVRSNELDNASWNKLSGETIGVNAIIAPNGAMEADAKIPPSGANLPYTTQAVTTVAATAYTFSVYAKNGTLGYPWFELVINSTTLWRAWFNLATGAKGTSANSSTSYNITNVGNGWYRVDMTVTVGATSTTLYLMNSTADGNTASNLTGDGVSPVVYVWGAQLELGTVATSPIPTFAASATRGPDNYNVTPASINHSATAGSWWVEYFGQDAPGLTSRLIGYASGGAATAPLLYRTNSPYFGLNETTTLVQSVSSAIGLHKVASAWQSGDRAITSDARTVAVDTGATANLAAPGALIGFGSTNGGNPMLGHIRKLRYVPRRKTNAELVTETTP